MSHRVFAEIKKGHIQKIFTPAKSQKPKMPYKKAKKAESDEDLRNYEQLQELESLNRQYKVMQNETKSAKNFVTAYVKKQQDCFLNNLHAELNDVDTNLKLSTCHAVKKKDIKNSLEIKNLKKAQLTFCEVVENEKKLNLELDDKIAELERQIEEQNKKTISGPRQINNVAVRLKRIQVYENRLNTGTVQFNKLLTDNNLLREKIEHYRKERTVFNNLYKKLQTRSTSLKFQIDEVIKQATNFYNIRDDHHSKMQTLSERMTADYKMYSRDVKEMSKTIEQTRELNNFMKIKNSEKLEAAAQEALIRENEYENRNDRLESLELKKYEKTIETIIDVLGEEKGKKMMEILEESGKIESEQELVGNPKVSVMHTLPVNHRKGHQNALRIFSGF